MSPSYANIQKRLKAFDFKGLFTQELMWNHFQARDLEVPVDGLVYTMSPVAQRGMAVYECVPLTDADFPIYAVRRKIDTQVSKSAREHIIIFHDLAKTVQVWQWVKREAGKPSACREQFFYSGQSGDALIHKIQAIAFSLDDEENIAETVERVGAAFDIEKVTKKFYELFKKEHDTFLRFVEGIPDKELEKWYVSVMLNRLMFIYFIQKKGFLSGDQHYLANKLGGSKKREKDKFYRSFLCPLFFEGFAKRPEQRSANTNHLLGQVPYLNGGLFLRHQIEELHGKNINIPDKAFDGIFSFFEQYDWHLDDRPTRTGREINPDVLGYVFEKYINQKEMGAYYSKEDITEYISKNTIIPALFDMARKSCRIAFEGAHSVWKLLQDDPDRYIHTPMLKGTDKELPKTITAGLNDVGKRGNWNKPADAEFALATETWREVVTRRTRCEEIRKKLASGEIHSIDDLVTWNLDIRRFAEEVIANCEGPELLRAFLKAIRSISVLDPTCGSGAFLFAGLNILERLYDTCLVRMQAFVDDLNRSDQTASAERLGDFRQTLEEVNDKTRHPNPRYFVLKSIILNNLYGVDIMEEATEICKLRLFLKLVAQVDAGERVEPLPDIDFNIRAGNTLVGYARYEDVEKAVKSKLDFGDAMGRIEDKAKVLDSAMEVFRNQQIQFEGKVTAEDKAALHGRFSELEAELNDYLSGDYGIKKSGVEKWKDSHKPFHWFCDFHRVMSSGGFDVIIGNPPYVESAKIRSTYSPKGLSTADSGNLYGMVVEVAFKLLGSSSRLGVIIPMSVVSTARMESVRNLILAASDIVLLSHYSGNRNPSVLFEGVEMRLTICIAKAKSELSTPVGFQAFSTEFRRWASAARAHLFATTTYVQVPSRFHSDSLFPKFGSEMEEKLLQKILDVSGSSTLRCAMISSGANNVYAHRIASYFVKALTFIPRFSNERDGAKRSEDYKVFPFANRAEASAACCVINSSLFYFYFIVFSDAYHCGRELIEQFPVDISHLSTALSSETRALEESLMRDLKKNSDIRKIEYKMGVFT